MFLLVRSFFIVVPILSSIKIASFNRLNRHIYRADTLIIGGNIYFNNNRAIENIHL